MSPVLVLGNDSDLAHVQRVMLQQRPELRFCCGEDPQAKDAEVVICWDPPAASLGNLPALKLIHSVGAGADPIFRESSRPPHVPVCRIVDPGHCQGMLEYVLWGVLHYHRQLDRALTNQKLRRWDRLAQQPASRTRVGVMGLGRLGEAAARQIALLGFETRGWARSSHRIEGVRTFDAGQLPFFLDGLDILVCLLPLTAQTEGILCSDTFAKLAPGAVLINCGRGAHLRTEDLLLALAENQLRGALLDVFEQEPLPPEHPLWTTPGVTLTPHIASSASFEVIAQQILANIERLETGAPLMNVVDNALGY